MSTGRKKNRRAVKATSTPHVLTHEDSLAQQAQAVRKARAQVPHTLGTGFLNAGRSGTYIQNALDKKTTCIYEL